MNETEVLNDAWQPTDHHEGVAHGASVVLAVAGITALLWVLAMGVVIVDWMLSL
ncbi:hypothetical protein [Streptomyces sp. H27-D2]|uniref:hypothetical protein n=1 Tax=Streptomyces sp. H27-D2 TaxID=3046304 RepID=UPI002DB7243E|nr:hypothetical protein [Streptomyces sp. H27-D2]MEC4017498.1 hypothetical protein [Streptomyces sp. H27-D2]